MPTTARLAVSRELMERACVYIAAHTDTKLDAHPARMKHTELTKALRSMLDADAAPEEPASTPEPSPAVPAVERASSYTPVLVAGNQTVHAGRQIGTYPSGEPRFEKACSTAGKARHDPSPCAQNTPITCKRCLAKLTSD